VIGIGLNLRLGPGVRDGIAAGALPPAALDQLAADLPDRNVLAATIATECATGLGALQREGFGPRRAAWNAADALAGQAVVVRGAGVDELAGIARGIDAGDGALRAVVAGDVSLRLQA
jgi:biotin-(acetyl-CoA carboxylase) ligase